MTPSTAVLLLIGFLAVPLFMPAFRSPLPLGYGGLYALMAEVIGANNFALPSSIPIYGPGGIPFAYPPLSFYLMAAVTQATGWSPIDYLRFAPPGLLLASAVVLLLFASALNHRTVEAWITAFLYATAAVVVSYHNEASGVCRGVALLNMLLALLFFQHFLQCGQRLHLLLTTLFFSLTALSHPSYLVFLSLSLCVLVGQARSRLWALPLIAAGGLTLALPWWGLVVWRHGIDVFAYALRSHGTLSLLGVLADPRAFGGLVTSIIPEPTRPRFWLTITGLIIASASGEWLLPAWLLLTGLTTGPEGDRFRMLPASFLAARALCWAGEQLARRTNRAVVRRFGTACFLALVVLTLYLRALRRSALTGPSITSGLVAAAQWVRENTPEQATFLLFSSDVSQQEMVPYFARRPAAAGPFGAEWTARYAAAAKLFRELNECIDRGSFDCATERLRAEGITIDTLVLPDDGGTHRLDAALAIDSEWKRVYASGGYSIWQRAAAGNSSPTAEAGRAAMRSAVSGREAPCSRRRRDTCVRPTARR